MPENLFSKSNRVQVEQLKTFKAHLCSTHGESCRPISSPPHTGSRVNRLRWKAKTHDLCVHTVRLDSLTAHPVASAPLDELWTGVFVT